MTNERAAYFRGRCAPFAVAVTSQLATVECFSTCRSETTMFNLARIISDVNHELMATDQPIDFTCRVCGCECSVAPDPPERAVCEEHCEDHSYKYDAWERGHLCVHCGKRRPDDWYEE